MANVVVVPTMNEVATIGPFVSALCHHFDAVLVADDSTDGTAERAHEAGAYSVPAGPGLWGAYRAAWGYVDAQDHVTHADAGWSHQIADIVNVAHGTSDITIGSRFCAGGVHNGSIWRRNTSKLAAKAMNLADDRGFTDWTSGLRSYSPKARHVLTKCAFKATGHAWQIESLRHAAANGLTIREVPIRYEASKSSLSAGRVREAVGIWWESTWSF